MSAPVLPIDPAAPAPELIARAAEVLRAGGLVAFPTETVYGLGANALDPDAVARIYAAKGRPSSDPIIVHVRGIGDLPALVAEMPPRTEDLVAVFWPGPLTLILPRGADVPPIVTAGLPAVAVRAPAHPVARALLAAAGVPIAAPSANPFGRTSPTTAAHVAEDLGERVDLILDGGPCPVGLESTVLDLTAEPPRVLRPGGLPLDALRRVAPDVVAPPPPRGPSASPGTLPRHYAPRARLVLAIAADAVTDAAPSAANDPLYDTLYDTLYDPLNDSRDDAESDAVAAALATAFALLVQAGTPPERIGLLLAAEDPAPAGAVLVERPARRDETEAAARGLFAALRRLDAAGAHVLLARDYGPRALGPAIRDRLSRAAEGRVVRVEAGGEARAAEEIAALARPR